MGKLYYVRHGQTPFNVRNQQWHDVGDPEDQRGFQFGMEFVDPPLNQVGQQQILKNKSEIQSLNVDLVYVSPMLRTLQTCNLLFEDALVKPKIVVNPFVIEWIHVNHDVPAWPNNHRAQFPDYDWSLMPEDYFIKTVSTSRHTERLNPECYTESLLKIMHEIYPEVFESRAELYRRAKSVKEKLRDEIKDKDILIVGHSAFYRHLTSEMVNELTFINEKLLKNGEYCEIEY